MIKDMIKRIGIVVIALSVLSGCSEGSKDEQKEDTAPAATVIVLPTKNDGTAAPTTAETTQSETTEKVIETTEEETTTEQPTTETPRPVELSASINGEHYIGDRLSGSDFYIKVIYSDGAVVENPEGWVADPLFLESDNTLVTVTYEGLSTQVEVNAVPRPTEPIINALAADHYVIVLDPGHGGSDGGAVNNFLVEKEMSLKVGFYCKAYLEEHYDRLTVRMTRETDTRLELDESGKDLKTRCRFAANAGATAMVSLHFNTTNQHNGHGATVLVSQNFKNEYASSLGNCILKQLSALGIENTGNMALVNEYGADYYAINRNCAQLGIVGVIVEHCFMDNAIDVAFCDSEEDLRALGEADARGIAEYLGLTPVR